ncbi:MAG: SUMF1/EgtB/PvdO family nonheme iron enzyme, partial [Planctomycetes bacterium]|nr:SUMF1/EgtB/PvdO family nonheme iron enzyme [Planctomycetota bacterium]
AAKQWKDTPLVVTSRPIKTQTMQEMNFEPARIDSFGSKEIRTFINHWVTALHDLDPEKASNKPADRYQEKLINALLNRPPIRALAANPVMLTCLCVVHWHKGDLPEGRTRVYDAVIDWLINARSKQRKKAGFRDRFALRGLACIALGMMRLGGAKRAMIDLGACAEMVEPLVKRDFPKITHPPDRREFALQWLRFECLGSSIVEEVAGNKIRFWHLTFQEYLAALQLAWLKDLERAKKKDKEKAFDPEVYWWPNIQSKLENPQWRETMELLPGCLFDKGGEGRVDRLLEHVLEIRSDNPNLTDDAKIVGIMGRMLQPMKAFEYQPDPKILSAFEEARQRALGIFNRDGSEKFPVKQRIQIAEALGQGGDPRFMQGKNNYLPIPGMKGFELGMYPVTVEEYQRFVDARGYEHRRFWDEIGWKLKTRKEWDTPEYWEEQLKTPNRPVVGVSWYEACAFCAWLSAMSEKNLRLPTESEWVAAAKPQKGEYPWGEKEPNPELANFGNNVDNPTPVGIYPQGVGPGGHFDLAGNVWEWCLNKTEEFEDWEKRHEGDTIRAVRGGCYWSSAEGLRFSARFWDPAWGRDRSIGFRVLSAPASTED